MEFVFDFLSILFSGFLLLYVWNERLLGCPIISLVFNVHALNLLRVHCKGKYLVLEVLTTYLENRPENVHHVFRVFILAIASMQNLNFDEKGSWFKRMIRVGQYIMSSLLFASGKLILTKKHHMAIKPLKKMSCTHAF